MANDLNRSIKIYIDGSEAQQGIAKVEAAVQKLEAKLSSLNKGEADYEAKSKELQKELNAKTRTLETYKKKVEETDRVLKNLSGATYQELLAVQKQVRKDLQNAVPGTEKYNAALEQNRRVTQQVAAAQKAMRVEVGSQGNMWLRASNFINQYLGIIGTVIAAVTGLTLKLNQLREARNKREEAKADVQALAFGQLGGQDVLVVAIGLAEQPLDAVAHHGFAHLLGYGEPDFQPLRRPRRYESEVTGRRPFAALSDIGERGALLEPVLTLHFRPSAASCLSRGAS